MMDASFLSYGFLQKALLMAIISGATCGAVGVFIVLWRVGFLGICVSHAAFAGALISLWIGVPPLAGGMIGSLGAAAMVGPMADRSNLSPDTAIGVIFSVALSLAVLALAMLPGARTEGLNFLWGSLLTVTHFDLILMAVAAVVLFSFIYLFFKEIQATISQRQAAIAAGIPAQAIFYIILILLGLIVAIALKAVGGILIYALIITPAATALQLTYSLKHMFLLSAFVGFVASVIGLWISFYWAIPTGAAIVLTATLLLVIAIIFSPKKQRWFS
jgi:ABC-type Mn2+/Zn2+ transport systems, permease components